jgi:NAD-dependent deacetylase
MNDISKLYEKIVNAKHCVVFSGAGVSTLSGIRDFRGKNGLYNDSKVDAEKIFDIEYFKKDPSFFYNAAKNFIYNLDEKEPSIVHITLAMLEKKGMIKAVITQNIDLLHQKAKSERVIEIHGSPKYHYCIKCHTDSTLLYEDIATILNRGELPTCNICGEIIKPRITFFGENLPVQALEDAQTQAQNADLMLVLGTTLKVYPAAGLPQTTLRCGGEIVIVNDMETHLDKYAVMRFTDLKDVFSKLNELL